MPTIKDRRDIAANAIAFPLQGNQYEYLPFDAMVEFALKADAGDNIVGTVYSGSDLLMQQARLDEIAVATAIQYPWDVDVKDVAAQGERLNAELREAGGVASTVRTVVWITPL